MLAAADGYSYIHLVVVALLVLYAVGGGIVAWGLAAITTALLGLLCVAESRAEL